MNIANKLNTDFDVEMTTVWNSELRRIPEKVLKYNQSWTSTFKNNGINLVCESPRFFSKSEFDNIAFANEVFLNAIALIFGSVMLNDQDIAADYLATPNYSKQIKKLCLDTQFNLLLARPDFFHYAGQLKFLEQNIGSTVGGISFPFLIDYFDDHPVMKRLRKSYTFEKKTFYSSYAKQLKSKGIDQTRNIGFFTLSHFLEGDPEFGNLKAAFKKSGLNVVLPASNNKIAGLEYRNKNLYVNAEKIDVLIRSFSASMILFRKPLLDLLLRISQTNTPIICGLDELFLSDKQMLAILNQHPDLISNTTRSEKESLALTIPWTDFFCDKSSMFRSKKIKLVDYALKNRHQFVLKRGQGHDSRHVYIGSKMTNAQWRKIVLFAAKNPGFIVQEHISRPLRTTLAVHKGEIVEFEHECIDGALSVEKKLTAISSKLYGSYKKNSSIVLDQTAGASVAYIVNSK